MSYGVGLLTQEILNRAARLLEDRIRLAKNVAQGTSSAREDICRLTSGFNAGAWTEREIDTLLQVESSVWHYEKPPLPWYTKALAFHFLGVPVSLPTKVRLMQAGNYYGDSTLVLELASLQSPATSETPPIFAYEITKQTAKAYKNLGQYEISKKIYRELISHAITSHDKLRISYFLMLFGKLCDDYQQMKSWHSALHRIAYDRLKKLPSVDPNVQRWKEIAAESYASLLYTRYPVRCERIFRRLMKDHQLQDDVYVRVLSHYCIARILFTLRQESPLKCDTTLTDLMKFSSAIRQAQMLGNIRAVNIRQVQYFMLCRKIEEFRRKNVSNVTSAFPQGLLYEEANSALSIARDGALALSDWKTAALAELERATWIHLNPLHSRPELSRNAYHESIDILLSAKNILRNAGHMIASLYHDVLLALAEANLRTGQLSEAAENYTLAYDFCKSLADSVQEDEAALEQVVASKNRESGAKRLRNPELLDLKTHELRLLLEELRVDYRLLLGRSLDIGERLQSLQFERSASAVLDSWRIYQAFNFHDVRQSLRHIAEATDITQIHLAVNDIRKNLAEWNSPQILKGQVARIELVNHVKNAIARLSEYHDIPDCVKFLENAVEIYVMFNDFLLTAILRNLIWNCVECAKRLCQSNLVVRVALIAEIPYAYLVVSDNAGDNEFFAEQINRLNAGKSIQSRRNFEVGGAGLQSTRDLIAHSTDITEPWVAVDHGEFKELRVPLGRIVSI